MKRLLAALFLALVLPVAGGVSARPLVDSLAPQAEYPLEIAAAAETPVVAPAPAETVASAPEAKAEAPAAEKSEAAPEWKVILFMILKFLLGIAGAALSVLVPALVMKALKKMGLENSEIANRVATSLVKKGINYAESLVSDPNNKPGPEQKKAAAVAHIVELAESTGLKKLAKEQIEKLIEGQLNRDEKKAA